MGRSSPQPGAIDIWIGEATDLGKGYGTQMMRLAIDFCFENPDVEAILIDPLATNVRAHRFYERLGFSFLERKTLGEHDDDTFVYRLERAKWKTDLNSPDPGRKASEIPQTSKS